ncbi:hypothetical protein ABTY20_22880 [Streptomyces sp. NPDC126497]|uniref:DNA polymerase III subunit beta n=1 Tax=Streptomyces sp. NPDC126497 TaxID=3155313 RepID=UPI0033329933
MTTQTQAPEQVPARFTTTHRALSDALKTVALGIADRPLVKVLGGVMAETADGALTLRGFDYETSVTVRVDGEAGPDGRSLLDLGELKNVLAAAVAGEKTADAARTPVTVDDGVLSTPDLAVPLGTLPLEDYPAFPPDVPAQVTVDGAEWFGQVARVLPAAGRDDTLPVMTYVHLRIAGGVLRLTASDRYRVTVGEVKAVEGGRAETAALVPAWLLEKMAKLLGKHTGPVVIGVDGDWATLAVGAVTVTVRCTADVSKYPDIWGLIPSDALPLAVRMDREALARAVRKAHAVSKAKLPKEPLVLLEFGPAGVTVSPGLRDETAQARVRGVVVDGETLAGADLGAPMAVDGLFLLDALGTFAGPTVTVHARTPLKPYVLTDGDAVTGDGFVHMLMPMRVER